MSTKVDIPKNDSKTVQVTVVFLYNGTYIVDSKEDPALQIVEIVLLVIVLLVSFGTNIFLLVTIASSYTLRRVPFNILLANLSVVFLFESLLNMSVALHFATADTWKIGYVGCTISSFIVQLVTLEVTVSLCILCAEGMASVWQPFRFQSYLTIKKQVVAIVIMWTAGILLCMPLLLKSITSRMFASRYGCASAGQDGFVHALFLTIWCYCLMILVGLGCLLNLGIRQYKEYRLQRKKSDVNYSNIFMQGDLWTEWVNFKLVAWLALFYLLLELPYIVIHQISALKAYPDYKDSNSTLLLPQIELTPKYETVFTWFRYIYSCVYPFMVFQTRKDIRHKFKALINCCHRNVIRDHSAAPIIRQDNKKNTKIGKKDSVLPLSLNTPVLYISPDGLCLRQLDKLSKSSNKHPNSNFRANPKFISYLCDLDSSISTEDFMSDSGTSFNSERRYSKESEVTLPDMSSRFSGNRLLEEVPLKDIDSSILEPVPVTLPAKKTVRFAETLTIYRTLTPRNRTPTPEWVVNKVARSSRRKVSKIPTRIRKVDHVTPWKVELNATYRVNSPVIEPKTFKKIVDEAKLTTTGGRTNNKTKSNFNSLNKIRRRHKFSSPPRWKINRLS